MASAPNHMMDAARAPCISSLPVFPHPLSLSSLPPALFSPALYLCLEMGCSLTQPPDHCMAASSVFPSWHKHYIRTDIILGKVLFPFLYFAFTQSSPPTLLLSPLALSSPLSPGAFCTLPLQSKRLGLSKANSQHRVP